MAATQPTPLSQVAVAPDTCYVLAAFQPPQLRPTTVIYGDVASVTMKLIPTENITRNRLVNELSQAAGEAASGRLKCGNRSALTSVIQS